MRRRIIKLAVILILAPAVYLVSGLLLMNYRDNLLIKETEALSSMYVLQAGIKRIGNIIQCSVTDQSGTCGNDSDCQNLPNYECAAHSAVKIAQTAGGNVFDSIMPLSAALQKAGAKAGGQLIAGAMSKGDPTMTVAAEGGCFGFGCAGGVAVESGNASSKLALISKLDHIFHFDYAISGIKAIISGD